MTDDVQDRLLTRRLQVIELLEAWHDREKVDELLLLDDPGEALELLVVMGGWFTEVLDTGNGPGFRERILSLMRALIDRMGTKIKPEEE